MAKHIDSLKEQLNLGYNKFGKQTNTHLVVDAVIYLDLFLLDIMDRQIHRQTEVGRKFGTSSFNLGAYYWSFVLKLSKRASLVQIKECVSDGPTDQLTDGPTNGPSD